jgi:hypothetical protein
MVELPPDEVEVWRAVVAALRSKGVTHAEAVEGAYLLLAAYQRQRDGLTSPTDTGTPEPDT